jgi:hypothetical protein
MRCCGVVLGVLGVLFLAGCGGASPHPRGPLSPADVEAFSQATSDISNQCLSGSVNELELSSDVTTILAIYKRDNRNSAFKTPSGSMLTMQQSVDTLIAALESTNASTGCDPTLGVRLAQGTGQ